MDFIADTDRNPFGMTPPCEAFVPGYGDTGAHFHVVGDNPAVHGGRETGIPFTDRPWSADFFDALQRAGLVERVDLDAGTVDLDRTYLSYLHACDPGEGTPTESDYTALEPFFDAELRAVTAHVLLPVGAKATKHVVDTCTARPVSDPDMTTLHATELEGSGWLVVPVEDPGTWSDGDADRLVDTLCGLQQRDYRRESDLGRFLPGSDPYLVR